MSRTSRKKSPISSPRSTPRSTRSPARSTPCSGSRRVCSSRCLCRDRNGTAVGASSQGYRGILFRKKAGVPIRSARSPHRRSDVPARHEGAILPRGAKDACDWHKIPDLGKAVRHPRRHPVPAITAQMALRGRRLTVQTSINSKLVDNCLFWP